MSTLSTTNLKNASSGSNNIVLNTDGTTTITAPSNIIKSGTAVASTSGTAIDFTGIPSWVKRVTVMFDGVSTNGTSLLQIQVGDSGGIETTGYLGSSGNQAAAAAGTANYPGAGFYIFDVASTAALYSGVVVISSLVSNTWVGNGVLGRSDTTRSTYTAGSKTLSATLDRIRITTVNGTDTFDNGTVNILYEG
jgi:hypothetical protein